MKFTIFENIFTSSLIVSIIVMVAICVFSIIVGKKISKYDYREKPTKLIMALEFLIGTSNDFCKTNLGKRWKSYASYLFVLIFYLVIANTIGMFGVRNPTSGWAITIAFSLVTVCMIYYTRFKERGAAGGIKEFFKPFAPMVIINLISVISTPLSMSLRLMVNMISSTAFAILLYGVIGWYAVPVAPIFHAVFDVFFGLIQAFVFYLLTLINVQQEIVFEDEN